MRGIQYACGLTQELWEMVSLLRNYVTATSTIGFVACNDRQQTMSMDYSPDIFLDHTHWQPITGSSAQKR